MLEIQDYEVMGFRMAINGMRNALNSWSNSDSYITDINNKNKGQFREGWGYQPDYIIGENDLKLCKKLIKAGSSDRKFLRMIHVQVNVRAPLYFWKEASTYKVATTMNSCSTMHKIHSKPITLDDFSIEDVVVEDGPVGLKLEDCFINVVEDCEMLRKKYIKSKDKRYWKALIQLLPSSYNQLRTWDLDYETLISIYFQRRNHKLEEWKQFCQWIERLPYMKEFISVLDKKEDIEVRKDLDGVKKGASNAIDPIDGEPVIDGEKTIIYEHDPGEPTINYYSSIGHRYHGMSITECKEDSNE